MPFFFALQAAWLVEVNVLIIYLFLRMQEISYTFFQKNVLIIVSKFEYFQAIWIGILWYVWHAGNIIQKVFLKYVQKVDFYLIIGYFVLIGRSSKSVSCAQFSYFL